MTTAAAERGEVIWTPPEGEWERSALGRLAAANGIADYRALIDWSVTDIDAFWAAATEFCAMRWFDRPSAIRQGDTMPGVTWFPGGTLNYADQALNGADRPDDAPAIIGHSQSRDADELTWGDVRRDVARCAAGLRRLGVGSGDRVVAYAPNISETLIAFLATASIGAIWSSCAPEFGVRSVVDRVSQIEPTVLIAVDGYRYGSKPIDRRAHLAELVGELPSLRHVVHVGYLDDAPLEVPATVDVVGWDDLLGSTDGPAPLTIEPVPADHPLYVLFSSGTTGLPKPIVHGHGGIVAEHLKQLALQLDLDATDRLFWFTTTGWMMWNFNVSSLLCATPAVLFDGDPASPGLSTLWNVAASTDATVFGSSASFLMACRKVGLTPERGRLRSIGSTGSPLPADGFRWVVDTLGVPVNSVCGGTDICTAFIGSTSVQPLRAGEIGGRYGGCAVEAFDPNGEPCPPGVTGELVITEPMPSMPVGFWNDPDGSRYADAYFSVYPGVWRHGDWVTFFDDGSCVVSGRSDATLNRGGVRLGTSDFYAVVESFEEIVDSLVVHLEDSSASGGLGELSLFVVLADGVELDDDLQRQIKRRLSSELSPRHAPDRIVVVPAVPRTLSGKKLEVPVKRILSGADPANVASRDSLADPAALDWFAANA